MSFSRGHKRRPTSIATDEILRTSMSNTYITPAGEVLQSSMVKNGSPSKRQLAGSTSQVRFSLPADDTRYSFSSEYSDEEDPSHDSFLSEDDWEDMDENNTQNGIQDDSFSRKQIVNIANKSIIEPPRGRSGKSKDRVSVGNSMRVLLSTSPERNKLFVRPHSELNQMPIPIPVELQLPPPLSPKNKGKARPSSLIYNGVDYEPLDTEFLTGKYLKRKLEERDNFLPPMPHDSAPTSPKRTPTRSQTRVIESVPVLGPPLKESTTIIMTDLPKSTDFTTVSSPQRYALDNENEIRNPSPAAKKLNNELNRHFSFPPRQHNEQRPQSEVVVSKSRTLIDHTDISKDLPPVPHPSRKLDINAAPQEPAPHGLQIYNVEGQQLQHFPTHEQQRNAYGRFGSPIQRRSLPVDIEQQTPAASRPIQFHQHRRSKSQIIDFQVEAADIIERQEAKQQQPLSSSLIYTHDRREGQEALTRHTAQPLVQKPLNIRKCLQPVEEPTQPLQVRKSARELPPNPPHFTIAHDDSFSSIQDSIQDSIQESIQYSVRGSIQDSIQDSIQESAQEESAVTNDDTQLFDLGDLIMTSGGALKLTAEEIDLMDQSIAAQSHIYDQPLLKNVGKATVESHDPDRYDVSLEYSISEEHKEQPLGTHLQPQPVFMRDNIEADHIRSASQLINFRLHKHVSSPLMSHSSYESEAMSEAFSNTGSDKTLDSVYSNEPREIVDLTRELEGMRLKPGISGRKPDEDDAIPERPGVPKTQDSIYKSELKEMDNGQFQETIILDSDEEEDMPMLNIRHKRSKSNVTDGSRAFSAFSFETIASEVQMRLSSDETSRSLTPASLTQTREVRRYGSKRKSVIEMCEDTMNTTREVMEDLKRQKTILLSRRKELMEEAVNDRAKLSDINELQEQLKQVKRRETLLKRNHGAQSSTASSIISGDVSGYFDYQNSQSYDFQTFMRSKSDVSLVEI